MQNQTLFIWLGGMLPETLEDLNKVNLLSFISRGSCVISSSSETALDMFKKQGGTYLTYTEGKGFKFMSFDVSGYRNHKITDPDSRSICAANLLADCSVNRMKPSSESGAFSCHRVITRDVTYISTFGIVPTETTIRHYEEIMEDVTKRKSQPFGE